ncbi:MFS transporter [Massilia terrae]|uniref:MFS transporter n=1 Tax=Massilia terrae TaxID=1811224 RepID=A0ABT2D2Z8_9BURK|nr:MFS transporter [Massilia terrae]MCS0660601.1 MFS transporter [Massilia terrae]
MIIDQHVAATRVVPAVGKGARNYALGLLLMLNTLLLLDKIVFVILLEPIKHEFNLSDLQLGVLSGLVYALLMGAAGLPFGLVADRTNRRNLASACLALWSVLTAMCGLAQNFVQLLLLRMGVGIGEAGGGPAALSIIADLFEHKKRATAVAIFALGSPLAALINLTVGTHLSHSYGWRTTLMAASVPGIVLALLMLLTMREPQRGAADAGGQSTLDAAPLRETLAFIRSQPALLHLLGAAALSYITLAGASSWTFSFLVRSHHVKLNEVGVQLGVAIFIAGIAGNYLSGILADYLSQRDERWRVWIIAAGALVSVLLGFGWIWSEGWTATLLLVGCFAAASTFWFAPAIGLCLGLVEVRMRATMSGVLFLIANMVGYGLGPIFVGKMSDLFTPAFGADSLRMALSCIVIVNLWAMLHFLLAGRSVRANLARANGGTPHINKR